MTHREDAFYAAMIARAGSLETYLKALELARALAARSSFPVGLPLSRKQIESAIDGLLKSADAA